MTDRTTQTEQANEKPMATFGPEIDLFCKHVDAIGDVLILMVMAVQKITEKIKKDMTEFESENCEVSESGDERTVKIPDDHFREWRRHSKSYEHFNLSRQLLPRSLLVSLISQYDAYLGRILRVIFIRKPEILNASEKKISFNMLGQFSSIEAAQEYLLETEVEAILRSSHADQFKWMESVFKLTLTKDLAIWPAFIELTERRNLFVHTDGVVSSQYIAVCKLHGCKLEDDIKEGAKLNVSQDYFSAAHHCIYEIGVKLGHVLWRRLLPDERAAADNHFVRVTYELIESGKWDLALRLLDFAHKYIKKFSSEGTELTLTVNRAQACKWKGDGERCREIMGEVDWSAKSDQFQLADAVLLENWSRSEKTMRRIGRDGAIRQNDYRDWPLFREFRKQKEFLDAYEAIFGRPFPKRSEVKKKGSNDEPA